MPATGVITFQYHYNQSTLSRSDIETAALSDWRSFVGDPEAELPRDWSMTIDPESELTTDTGRTFTSRYQVQVTIRWIKDQS